MAVSKIIYDGVGIDLTADTVTAGHLESGYTAHNSNGEIITGTLVPSGSHSPSISVTAGGSVMASCGGQTATHLLSSSDDPDFVAQNIKKDVSIFGVTGSFEGGVTPSGTINISSNGTFDVSQFASALVNVPDEMIISQGTYTFASGSSTLSFSTEEREQTHDQFIIFVWATQANIEKYIADGTTNGLVVGIGHSLRFVNINGTRMEFSSAAKYLVFDGTTKTYSLKGRNSNSASTSSWQIHTGTAAINSGISYNYCIIKSPVPDLTFTY